MGSIFSYETRELHTCVDQKIRIVQIKISVYFFLRYLLLLSRVSFRENNSSCSLFYPIKHTCMSEGTHIC